MRHNSNPTHQCTHSLHDEWLSCHEVCSATVVQCTTERVTTMIMGAQNSVPDSPYPIFFFFFFHL